MRDLIERIGRALSTGDIAGVAECWGVPALVLADQGCLTVSDNDQVEQFFARAIQAYNAVGLVSTRGSFLRVESLTDRLSAVDLEWTAFDAAGTQRSTEPSYYLRRLGDDGQARVRVALTRTA